MRRGPVIAGGVIVACAATVALVSASRRSTEENARCHAEATALGHWMEQLDAEGGGSGELPIPRTVTLVALDERADGGADGPVLAFDGDVVLVDGSATGSLRNPEDATRLLGNALADRARLWTQTHPGKTYAPAAPTVAVDRAAPWSRVATLLEVAAQAGVTEVWFAFAGTTRLTPPPETDVSRALRKTFSGEAVDPSQTVRLAVQQDSPLRHVYARCEAVGEALAPLASEAVDPAQKNAAFLKAIPAGIEACGCKVDLDEVEAMQWARYGRYEGTPKVLRQVALARRGAGDASPVTAPADKAWSEAHTRVLDASRRGTKVFFATE